MRKFGEMKSSELFAKGSELFMISSELFIKGSEPIKNAFFTLLFVSRFLFIYNKRILTELFANTLFPSLSSVSLIIFSIMVLPYRK